MLMRYGKYCDVGAYAICHTVRFTNENETNVFNMRSENSTVRSVVIMAIHHVVVLPSESQM